MSFEKASVNMQSINTKERADVSHSSKKHSINFAGKPITEIEIAPHDTITTSIGTFKENNQPKGFLVEYNIASKDSYLIQTAITTNKLVNGVQYLLEATNNTNRAICVEVKVL
ncbi:MAG TPA: hypothetical protein VFZ58_00795 [Candidatus Saccharimonadales bacterium]